MRTDTAKSSAPAASVFATTITELDALLIELNKERAQAIENLAAYLHRQAPADRVSATSSTGQTSTFYFDEISALEGQQDVFAGLLADLRTSAQYPDEIPDTREQLLATLLRFTAHALTLDNSPRSNGKRRAWGRIYDGALSYLYTPAPKPAA